MDKRYQRIEDLREDADMSQEKMAELMKTSKTQYQRFENSNGNNFFEAMIQIAKIHKVSLDYIAGLTNDKGGLHKNNKYEQEFLSLFNKLSEQDKNRIIGRMQEITERKEKGNININQTVNIKGSDNE